MNRLLLCFVSAILVIACTEKEQTSGIPITVKRDQLEKSIGIETIGGVFTPLIEAGSTQPIEKKQIFSTYADGQSQITIKVYYGSEPLVSGNSLLGEFRIEPVPPMPRGEPQVEINFRVVGEHFHLLAKGLNFTESLQIKKVEQGRGANTLPRVAHD